MRSCSRSALRGPWRGDDVRPVAHDRLLLAARLSLACRSGWVTSRSGVLGRVELEQFFRGESPLWLIGLVAVSVLLVLPALAALGAWTWMNSGSRGWLYSRSGRLNAEHRTQTSWDFAFNHEQDLLLVAELKDGSRVAGYYGERSHSGYGTSTRDLFLVARARIARRRASRLPARRREAVSHWCRIRSRLLPCRSPDRSARRHSNDPEAPRSRATDATAPGARTCPGGTAADAVTPEAVGTRGRGSTVGQRTAS